MNNDTITSIVEKLLKQNSITPQEAVILLKAEIESSRINLFYPYNIPYNPPTNPYNPFTITY